MKNLLCVLLCVCLITLAGCEKAPETTTSTSMPASTIKVSISPDDQAAIAKKTVEVFRPELKKEVQESEARIRNEFDRRLKKVEEQTAGTSDGKSMEGKMPNLKQCVDDQEARVNKLKDEREAIKRRLDQEKIDLEKSIERLKDIKKGIDTPSSPPMTTPPVDASSASTFSSSREVRCAINILEKTEGQDVAILKSKLSAFDREHKTTAVYISPGNGTRAYAPRPASPQEANSQERQRQDLYEQWQVATCAYKEKRDRLIAIEYKKANEELLAKVQQQRDAVEKLRSERIQQLHLLARR